MILFFNIFVLFIQKRFKHKIGRKDYDEPKISTLFKLTTKKVFHVMYIKIIYNVYSYYLNQKYFDLLVEYTFTRTHVHNLFKKSFNFNLRKKKFVKI